MARKRDYKEEYRRRIARGAARGKTRAQARGHAPVAKSARRKKPGLPASDPKLETALKALREGRSLSAAARAAHVSPERLRRFLSDAGLARREGRRWSVHDDRSALFKT